MVRFLAKFVKEVKHADMLRDGQLFTRPSLYYMPLEGEEEGQSDSLEGAVSYTTPIRKGRNYHIFCLYAIDEAEIEKGRIAHINTKCVEDFDCKTGYLLILDYSEFKKKLDKSIEGIDTDYAYESDLVKYTNKIDKEDTIKLMTSDESSLFFKRVKFAHQNEFRIAIYESIEKENYNTNPKEYHKIYNLKKPFEKSIMVPLEGIDLSQDTFKIDISSMFD